MSNVTEYGDDWANEFTGLGSTIKDKSEGVYFAASPRLSRYQLDALYSASALVARIVDKPADDAFRAGWKYKIQGQDNKGQAIDNKIAQKRIEKYALSQKTRKAAKWARLYGGAVVTIPTIDEDGRKPCRPMGDVKALFAPAAVAAYEATVQKRNTQWGSPHFREPNLYSVSVENVSVDVHRTRVIPIEEVDLPYEALVRMSGTEATGWGPGVVERIYAEFSRYGATHKHASAMLYIASILFLKFKDFRQWMTSKDKTKVRQILENLRQGLNSLGVAGIDAEDDFGVLSLNLSNLPDLLDRFTNAMVAVGGMPKEILMNESPAGLNAGMLSGPQELWFAQVDAYRKEKLEPALVRWSEVAFEFWGWKVEEVEIDWNPLHIASGKTQAEECALWAQSDKTYFEMGAITAEEIREQRFVQGRKGPLILPEPPDPPVLDLSAETAAEEDSPNAPSDAMSAEELSPILKVSRASILSMRARGEIGAWRIGNRWRFSLAEVLKATRRPASVPEQ